MRDGEPGWFYVGNGQLRYKDSDGWTEQYEDLDGPPKTAPVEPPASADVPGSGIGETEGVSGHHPSLARLCSSSAHVIITLLSRLGVALWRHMAHLGRVIADLWGRAVAALWRVIAGLYQQPSAGSSDRSVTGRHRGP
jgi:hypothetical protein